MNRSIISFAFCKSPLKASVQSVIQIGNDLRFYSTEIRQQEPIIVFLDQKNARSKWQKLFGQDKRYPFPGDVTSKLAYNNEQVTKLVQSGVKKITLEEVLDKRANPVKREALCVRNSEKRIVELKAMECPKLLRKDIQSIFKDVKLNGDVSVVNFMQKTKNDMSLTTADVELERLQLTASFIEVALRICEVLRKGGFWADFIDPSSGRPYFGKTTKATFFGTDELYRTLGFQVVNLGCCKVLKHGIWGANVFVGTVFTDAPIHAAVFSEILELEKD